MRILGLVLALGAIVWVMLQAAGGGDAETVIPEGHMESLQKAEAVEQMLQNKATQRMQEMEQE